MSVRLGLTLFRSPLVTQYRAMSSPAVLASKAILSSIDLSKYDTEQAKLMDERCILVDEEDRALGAADKKTCTVFNNYRHSLSDVVKLRSLNGEHQQGTSSSCLFRICVQAIRWQTTAPTEGIGEDYLP